MTRPRTTLWMRRLLVMALFISFAACLLAIWSTGTLLGGPGQLLPAWLLQIIVAYRIQLLTASCVCLIICYGTLRHVTGDIMAVPERFLDERQKMVRDQAHRTAFRFIKLACCLIPLLLVVQYLPWLRPAPPASPVLHPAPVEQIVWEYSSPQSPIAHAYLLHNGLVGQMIWVYAGTSLPLPRAAALKIKTPHTTLWAVHPSVMVVHMVPVVKSVVAQSIPVVSASPTEIALAAVILLLCLFLLVSALPMSIIAWKRDV